MNSNEPIVFVVDDDYRVCEALSTLKASVGPRVVAFESRDQRDHDRGHQGQIIPKMGARSPTELVRMSGKLGIARIPTRSK